MVTFLLILISIFLSACTSVQQNRDPQSIKAPYCGCLIFVDDVKDQEILNDALQFRPDFLPRSWFRWGEPTEEKAFTKRAGIISSASDQKIGIGGGTSLSVVNERDLTQPNFDRSWLSINLDGSLKIKNNHKYASLSAPGFRKYLVGKLTEQVRLGVKELHLGEPSGEIHFDDWTLGIKGNSGSIHWLKVKYSVQSSQWWSENFGDLGIRIQENRPIARENFFKLSASQTENFHREFGKTGSWNGENTMGQPSFLSFIYKHNLESFLKELRSELDQRGYREVVIDVWGFANWMPEMSVQPNAYLSTPPDERWNLNWATDSNFDLNVNRERIKKIMSDQITSVKPVPVVYMIDHSKPFDDFKKLPDGRQAEITLLFSDITKALGANFIYRSYSNDKKSLGPKTTEIIKKECALRKLNFCPQNM